MMSNKNLFNYKAQRFQSELNKTTFAYEVKRVRAMWDPTLSIPGTNRRGGWRCPIGTRYGGQITDRFGRNCGWGVARRIANAISNIGERMENLDDRRRGRRVERRNRRMVGRLQQNAQAGRAERGLRGIANALEGGDAASTTARREERIRRRAERQARRDQMPPAGQLGRGWRGVLSEGNRRYNEQGNRPWWGEGQPPPRPEAPEVEVPESPTTPEAVEPPKPPKPPKRPRKPRVAPAGAEDERDAGLRESERRRVRRELEEPGAPRTAEGEEAPPKPPRKRPNRRRAASDEMAAESVTRRPPTPKDEPQGGQKKPSARINLDEEMIEIAENESMPDTRSLRNVNNRFPKSGLPKSAYWRKPDYNGDDKDKLEKRFERYYDADGNINNRGRWINKEIERRKREGGLTPKGRKPRKPKAQEEAPKKPDWLPKEPPKMPDVPIADQGPAEERNDDFRRLQEEQRIQARERYKLIWRNGDEEYDKADKEIDGLDEAALRDRMVSYSRGKETWADSAAANRQLIGNTKYEDLANDADRKRHIDQVANIMYAEKQMAKIDESLAKMQKRLDAINAGKPVPAVDANRARQTPIFGAKAVVNDNKLGNMEGGLPSGKGVPIGNKGLNTKQDAIKHIAAGGDISDVPDDFVMDALDGNVGDGKRFKSGVTGGGGNVNGALKMYKDTKTGKMFLIKYANGGSMEQNEDIYEILGNNIAGRVGFAVGEFRFAGPVQRNKGNAFGKPAGHLRPVIFEHSENLVEGVLAEPKAMRDGYAEKIGHQDIVAATALDFLVLNTDRHGGNFFLARDKDGKLNFVPIDMSLGFGARSFDADKSYANDEGFAEWLEDEMGGDRNEMLSALQARVKSGKLSREDVRKELVRVQDNLRKSEQAKKYADFGNDVYNARGERAAEQQGIEFADARIKYFVQADPDRLVDIILDPQNYR